MNFDDLRKIKNEREQVNQTYNIFKEADRLSNSPAAKIEFITTVHYIEKYLHKNMKILDIGAGAGAYSLYFAKKGYDVDALELADRNVAEFRKRIISEMSVRLRQGDATDLSAYDDNSFDIVLLMGPLYHLHNAADRSKCICEAMRVLKPNGILFASFINHDMVFITELKHNNEYFINGDYNHETMRLNDFPFVFFTIPEARTMLTSEGFRIIKEIASDGVSELMADEINKMSEESYKQYLKYHFYCCEKSEMLGFSNHLLFVCKADTEHEFLDA